MEKCHEYFVCNKWSCPARVVNKPCWKVEETECGAYDRRLRTILQKEDKCSICTYKKIRNVYNG